MTELAESLLKCRVEGNTVFLPSMDSGPLSNYAEVRKALLNAGAKYKRNTFVFASEAQPFIDRLVNGNSINIKKEFQFFATPAAVVKMMIDKIPVIGEEMKMLEPSAGDGAIIYELINQFPWLTVDCFEIMDINRNELKKLTGANLIGDDFLKCGLKNTYDIIIANPPFTKNQDIDHIRKMFEVCKPGGLIITLASPSWTFGSNKKQTEFRAWLKELNAELTHLEEGAFKESGTAIRPVLLVFKKPTQEINSSDDATDHPRFSDKELREFKVILENKKEAALKELEYLKGVYVRRSKGIKEEDFTDMPPSEVQKLLDRQENFITKLSEALDRIKNKTFGICKITGNLIDKERLRAVPHTTLSSIKVLTSKNDSDDAQKQSPLEEHIESLKENESVRKCRICGCTDDDCSQCIAKTGSPCHWVEDDLCSACEKINDQTNKTEIIMDFFKQLAAAGPVDLTMRILQKDDKLTVNIIPGTSNGKISPLIVTGTPEELDDEFFSTITSQVKEVVGLVSNIEQVKQQAQKIADNEKKKPEAKKAAEKPTKKQDKKSVKKAEKKSDKNKKKKPVEKDVKEVVNVPEPDLFNSPVE